MTKEKIEFDIEETKKDISNIQVVIQELKAVEDTAKRTDEKYRIRSLINSLDNEVNFLEELNTQEEEYLLKNGMV